MTSVMTSPLDFSAQPWPSVSPAAKDCISKLLHRDPAQRASCAQILQHEWLVNEECAVDIALDSVVLNRMASFSSEHKLKKVMVSVNEF